MIGKWRWHLKQIMRRIWVRAVSYALLGVLTALLAIPFGPLIPEGIGARLGVDAVDRVLSILASSMLAVTTFSLSIMVSALGAASNAATPRVARLLYEDRTSQTVLASFIGAFLFSLVGLITVQAGAYDEGGRVLLFVVTIGVVAMIVAALLRWISHLMEFGRMSDAISRAETAASDAYAARCRTPFLGGRPLRSPPPDATSVLPAQSCGYIQHIDMPHLSEFAESHDCRIWLSVLPGSYVYPGRPLLHHDAEDLPDEETHALISAFTIGKTRNFDQDPRFGLIVLAEIASRALSPAINDPGTAIDVIGRLLPVMVGRLPGERSEMEGEGDPPFPRLNVPPLKPRELLEDSFLAIARDGAGHVEIGQRLLKALYGLATAAPELYGRAVRDVLPRLIACFERGLADKTDLERIRTLAEGFETLPEYDADAGIGL
ncbi:MAG: DUF2254 domain-containing protein [Rhodothalassiaceae bacterium]